jgi:hypothetical protein
VRDGVGESDGDEGESEVRVGVKDELERRGAGVVAALRRSAEEEGATRR